MSIKFTVFAGLTICCLLTVSCRKQEIADEEFASPAKVEHLPDDQATRITLTEEAVRRIDIQTSPILELNAKNGVVKAMPYSALLYDPQGNTWVYSNRQPRTYVREPVRVDRFDGDRVILAQGPAAQTPVVTVGASELFGSEEEFEEE